MDSLTEQNEPNKINQCQMCLERFTSVEEFGNHVDKDHSGHDSWYSCSECYSIFDHRFGLSDHMVTKHGVKSEPLTCPIEGCDQQLSRVSILRKHLKELHDLEPEEYFSSNNITLPIVDKRPCRVPIKCPFEGCYKVLSRRYHLQRHITTVHKQEPGNGTVPQEEVTFVIDGGGESVLRESKQSSTVTTRSSRRNEESAARKIAIQKKDLKPSSDPIQDTIQTQGVTPVNNCDASVLLTSKTSPTVTVKTQREESGAKKISIPKTCRKSSRAPVQCPIERCNKVLSRRYHLICHMKRVHNQDLPNGTLPQQVTPVNKGDKTSSTVTAQNEETEKIIIPKKGQKSSRAPVQCPIEGCNKVLSRRYHLICHMKRVHNKKVVLS